MLNDGATQHEASTQLIELTRAILLQGKAGRVTLEITGTPATATAVKWSAEVRIKSPKVKPEETLLFVDTENGFQLTKQNTRQKELAFSEVKRPEREVREVDKAPVEIKQLAVNQ